jgi:hypothetical protein
MKIQLKPFKIYVEKYHVEGGNIYPPRILNLKRVGIILLVIIGVVVMLSSCSRYTIEGSSKSSCGVWHPRKFKVK